MPDIKNKKPKVVSPPNKATPPSKGKEEEKSPFVEIDVEDRLNASSFIIPEANGFGVSVYGKEDGKPANATLVYLFEDGERRKIKIELNTLTLNGKSYLVSPLITGGSIWSKESRDAWEKDEENENEELLSDLSRTLRKYLHFEDEVYFDIVVAYILLTYWYPVFRALGYLRITGPKGTGKSKVLDLLSELVRQPLATSNVSAASLFRTLGARGGTLLLDEAEGLANRNDERGSAVNEILLAGNKVGGSVSRCGSKETNYRPVEFLVFGPKVIAGINDVRGPLKSRCIVIQTMKAPAKKNLADQRWDDTNWQELRDDLHVFSLNYGNRFFEFEREFSKSNEMPLSNRAVDSWRPLIVIGKFLESLDFQFDTQRMIDFAIEASRIVEEDSFCPKTLTLMQALKELLEDAKTSKAKSSAISRSVKRMYALPTCSDVLNKAREMDGDAFKLWSPRLVSAALKSFGIRTGRKKIQKSKRFGKENLEKLELIKERWELDL